MELVYDQILTDWLLLFVAAAALAFLLHECGLLSLGHGAQAMVGAYLAAFVATGELGVPAAVGVAGFSGGLLGLLVLRVRADIFAVLTLAAALLAHRLAANAAGLTSGALGIPFSTPAPLKGWWAPLAVGVVALGIATAYLGVASSRLGLAAGSVRDNETLSRALGVRSRALLYASVLATSVAAALGGALAASYIGFVSPSAGSLDRALQPLAAAMLARPLWRQGRPWRVLFGCAGAALVLVLVPPVLRLVFTRADEALLQQVVFGLALYLLVAAPIAREWLAQHWRAWRAAS